MMRLARFCAVFVAAIPLAAGAQQPTFRATADAVWVDVSVVANRQPVPGLTPTDFSLADNGVAQRVEAVERVSGPIDLSLLVDTGRDALRFGLARMIADDAAGVRALLTADDRLRLVTFDSQMREGPAPGNPARRGEAGTTLIDALVAAAMRRVEPGRRHLIVAITTGVDTHSVVGEATRRAVLGRSDAPVHIIASGLSPMGVTLVVNQKGESLASNAITADYTPILRGMTDLTGGRLFDIRAGRSVLDPLGEVLREFRTRYVLRYEPAGVPKSGWHIIDVKLTRLGAYDIQARRGYFRSP